jgi:hypothetical protein
MGVVQNKIVVLVRTTTVLNVLSPNITVAPGKNPVPVMGPHASPPVDPAFGATAVTDGGEPDGTTTGDGVG